MVSNVNLHLYTVAQLDSDEELAAEKHRVDRLFDTSDDEDDDDSSEVVRGGGPSGYRVLLGGDSGKAYAAACESHGVGRCKLDPSLKALGFKVST